MTKKRLTAILERAIMDAWNGGRDEAIVVFENGATAHLLSRAAKQLIENNDRVVARLTVGSGGGVDLKSKGNERVTERLVRKSYRAALDNLRESTANETT